MQAKPALETYKELKGDIRKNKIITTTLHCTGGKHQSIESACAICGDGKLETVGRVVLDREGLNTALLEEESYLARALGVSMTDEPWVGSGLMWGNAN